MGDRVYLDWNATAPLRSAARSAACAAMDLVGNPSSVHGDGRAARRVIETARADVAALVGTDARNVIFTSGGTEANALALSPAIETAHGKAPRDGLLISAIEHPSVRAGARLAVTAEFPVDAEGVADLAGLEQQLGALRQRGIARPLVSLMLANNETGAVQPVVEAAAIVRAAGGLLHVDAVQAAGRIAIDINALGADLMTLSAHKIGGPKGAGALIRRDEALHLAEPLIKGGGQERGYRAGTENVAAIAGFGAAAAEARQELARERAHMAALRDRLESGIRAASPQAVIFAARADRLPNTTLVAPPGGKAETLVIAFDLEGIAVSSGAACSSGRVAPSHVLAAMGIAPALARGAIRLSTGPATAAADVERFLQVWQKCVSTLSKGEKRGLAA